MYVMSPYACFNLSGVHSCTELCPLLCLVVFIYFKLTILRQESMGCVCESEVMIKLRDCQLPVCVELQLISRDEKKWPLQRVDSVTSQPCLASIHPCWAHPAEPPFLYLSQASPSRISQSVAGSANSTNLPCDRPGSMSHLQFIMCGNQHHCKGCKCSNLQRITIAFPLAISDSKGMGPPVCLAAAFAFFQGAHIVGPVNVTFRLSKELCISIFNLSVWNIFFFCTMWLWYLSEYLWQITLASKYKVRPRDGEQWNVP